VHSYQKTFSLEHRAYDIEHAVKHATVEQLAQLFCGRSDANLRQSYHTVDSTVRWNLLCSTPQTLQSTA